MVVAQFAEWSLPNPEVRGSNPVIGKKIYWTFTFNCVEKTKKKKEAGNCPFYKNINWEEIGTAMMNKQRKAKGTYICANRNKVKNYKRIWSIKTGF